MEFGITAVVVTYNRKSLLQNCLHALTSQTRMPDHILIVDNASTDGTHEMLNQQGWLNRADIKLLTMDKNCGGAGGFAAGIDHAVSKGADWIWIMDDDAKPFSDALEALVKINLNPCNIYGSTAIFGDNLCWPIVPVGGNYKDTIKEISKAPELINVKFIPFLGFFVHRDLVAKIGLPDAGFFIAADDFDYSLRARKFQAEIILVRNSRIEHPIAEGYYAWLPWYRFYCLRLAPWKRYYDIRNRILVAKTHYGASLYYSTIPGSFLRLFTTLLYEPQRFAQIRAFIGGMVDGLRGRKGCRHAEWGL